MGTMLTTRELASTQAEGSVILMDGDVLTYHGMTWQGTGDANVHFRYADSGKPFDIEVAHQDVDENYWESA